MNYSLLFSVILISLGIIITFVPKLLLPKIEKKWHPVVRLASIAPIFLIVFFLFLQGYLDTIFITVFVGILFIPRILTIARTSTQCQHKKYLLFLIFITTAIIMGLFRFGAEWLKSASYQPIDSELDLLNWTGKIGWGKQDIPLVLFRCLISGFVITGISFFFFGSNFNSNRKKKQAEEASLQAELSQTQLEFLYARINPEFLHHSLNSIADLALNDGIQTREKALQLSNYFRYCMNKEKRNLVSVEEETDMTKIFIEFEQKSYPGNLSYHLNLPQDANSLVIPRLLLQSLADLSIREARKNNIHHLSLTIDIDHISDQLIIIFQDNGSPFPENFNHNEQFIRIREKLELAIPDTFRIDIHGLPKKEIMITLKNSRYL